VAYIDDDGHASESCTQNNNGADPSQAGGYKDTHSPGCSLFENAIKGGVPAGNTFTTSGGNVVQFTNVPVSKIDANPNTALYGYDTVILYVVCDIGGEPTLMKAINNFVRAAYDKLIIYDADACGAADNTTPNYSSFVFPFTLDAVGPVPGTGQVTWIEPEKSPATLTRNLKPSNIAVDTFSNSNVIIHGLEWCGAAWGSNADGWPYTNAWGWQLAYVPSSPSNGLVIYVGYDSWATERNGWDTQLLSNVLDQPFNPDSLPCLSSPRISVGIGVGCSPTPVVVGKSVSCKATVKGSSPTGNVTWSSTGPGKFSKNSCLLSKDVCSVRYTPTSAKGRLPSGTGINRTMIMAVYSGDKNNPSLFGVSNFTVGMKASKTTVSCAPKSVAYGTETIKCTARVAGYWPTGEVTWSQIGGTGSIVVSPTCSLLKGLCSVVLVGTQAGTVTAQAVYGGDGNNTGSSGAGNLKVVASSKTFSTWTVPTSNATIPFSPLTVGETFIIQLSANPSTGYDWNVTTTTGIMYVNYAVVGPPPPCCGYPVTRDYFFIVTATGPQTITLRYMRSFAPSVSPTIITINVNPSSTIVRSKY
jgi:predicted secreted protein